MIIALIGNPNSGKTTLFNQLTGSKQKVGNFPGVTVAKKTAPLRGRSDITLVDLPGIYSLSPYSAEEIVTRDFLIDEKPDAIINILDATNIERSLYLTLQLIEMEIPLIIALNMMDEIRAKGTHVHLDELEKSLGVPIVPITASKKQGISELRTQTIRVAEEHQLPVNPDLCSGAVHRTLHAICVFTEDHAERAGLPSRYAATKICERDKPTLDRLQLSQNEIETCEHMVLEMESSLSTDNLAALSDMRYCFIDELCSATVHKGEHLVDKRTQSIDRFATHRIWSIPIFLLLMLATFWIAFGTPGQWAAEHFDALIGGAITQIDNGLTALQVNPVLHGLVTDGILTGVGSVLSFLPLS